LPFPPFLDTWDKKDFVPPPEALFSLSIPKTPQKLFVCWLFVFPRSPTGSGSPDFAFVGNLDGGQESALFFWLFRLCIVIQDPFCAFFFCEFVAKSPFWPGVHPNSARTPPSVFVFLYPVLVQQPPLAPGGLPLVLSPPLRKIYTNKYTFSFFSRIPLSTTPFTSHGALTPTHDNLVSFFPILPHKSRPGHGDNQDVLFAAFHGFPPVTILVSSHPPLRPPCPPTPCLPSSGKPPNLPTFWPPFPLRDLAFLAAYLFFLCFFPVSLSRFFLAFFFFFFARLAGCGCFFFQESLVGSVPLSSVLSAFSPLHLFFHRPG